MTSLQSVLANKQSRGAFGQGRMEIDRSGRPAEGLLRIPVHADQQACGPIACMFLPDKRPLVIDAKFPLEAITRLSRSQIRRRAQAGGAARAAGRRASTSATSREKYLIPGETQEMALMFVPSESVYAELHDGFDDVVQKALQCQGRHRLAVAADDRDPRHPADPEGRAHARGRRPDSGRSRAADRGREPACTSACCKLQSHFNQANEDIRQIVISAEKIEKRGERIAEVEFERGCAGIADVVPAPMLRKLEAGE